MNRVREGILRRAGQGLELFNDGIGAVADAIEWVLWLSPPFVLALAFGLAAWRGRRLLAGVAAVVAVHASVWLEMWSEVVTTLAAGTVASMLTIIAALLLAFLGRHSRFGESPSRRGQRLERARPRGGQATVALYALGITVAIAPLLSGPQSPAWIGISGLTALAVLMWGPAWSSELRQSRLGRLHLMARAWGLACAATVAVGLVSGDGVGGAIRQAAQTNDVRLGLRAAGAAGAVATVTACLVPGRREVATGGRVARIDSKDVT